VVWGMNRPLSAVGSLAEPLRQQMNFLGRRISLCQFCLMASFDTLVATVLSSIQNGFLHLPAVCSGNNYHILKQYYSNRIKIIAIDETILFI
jgi:hypothetical protein